MGSFIIGVLIVFNIVMWVVILAKFKKLFSTDDIIAETKENCNSILKDLNSNVDRDITLADGRIETLASLMKVADKKIKLLSDLEKSYEKASILQEKSGGSFIALSANYTSPFDKSSKTNKSFGKSAKAIDKRKAKIYEDASAPILPTRDSDEDSLVDIASSSESGDISVIEKNTGSDSLKTFSAQSKQKRAKKIRGKIGDKTSDDDGESDAVDVGDIFESGIGESIGESVKGSNNSDSGESDRYIKAGESDERDGYIEGGKDKEYIDNSGNNDSGDDGDGIGLDKSVEDDSRDIGENDDNEYSDENEGASIEDDEDYNDDINSVGDDIKTPRRQVKSAFRVHKNNLQDIEGGEGDGDNLPIASVKTARFNPVAFVNPKLAFKDQVIAMFDSGMSVEDISEALSRSAVEIQLVLDVEGRG